jgi:hypothetical protein
MLSRVLDPLALPIVPPQYGVGDNGIGLHFLHLDQVHYEFLRPKWVNTSSAHQAGSSPTKSGGPW